MTQAVLFEYRHDQELLDASHSEVSLPGSGDPGSSCGMPVPKGCNTCGHTWVSESHCMMRTCPNCWRKWAWKASRRESLRAWAGSILKVGWRRRFRLLHVVVSFRDDGDADLPTQRKRAISIMKKHGISGGLTIWHPFRKHKDEGIFIPDGYVHFHCIGLARDHVMPSIESQGYVFKVIQDARGNGYKGFKKVAHIRACIFYLLTHCGVLKGRHAMTWYGELSYNMLPNRKLEEFAPDMFNDTTPAELCPSCGSEDIETWNLDPWTAHDQTMPYLGEFG